MLWFRELLALTALRSGFWYKMKKGKHRDLPSDKPLIFLQRKSIGSARDGLDLDYQFEVLDASTLPYQIPLRIADSKARRLASIFIDYREPSSGAAYKFKRIRPVDCSKSVARFYASDLDENCRILRHCSEDEFPDFLPHALHFFFNAGTETELDHAVRDFFLLYPMQSLKFLEPIDETRLDDLPYIVAREDGRRRLELLLNALGSQKHLSEYERQLKEEQDPFTLRRAINGLGKLDSPVIRERLATFRSHSNWNLREDAAEALQRRS